MIRFFVLSVALYVSYFATASAQGSKGSSRSLCETQSQLAELVMQERQRGVTVQEQLDKWEDIERKSPKGQDSDWVSKFRTRMILNAYKRPQFSRHQQQYEAVKSFKESAFIDCMESSL